MQYAPVIYLVHHFVCLKPPTLFVIARNIFLKFFNLYKKTSRNKLNFKEKPSTTSSIKKSISIKNHYL